MLTKQGGKEQTIPSQDLTTLQACLDEYFIKEEVFDDPKNYVIYQGNEPAYAVFYGEPVPDVRKKTYLVNPPGLLILSLNRFKLDDYGTKTKLNHVVKIPETLNMSRYVKEIFEAESYDYTLESVVAHKGSTDSGHYIAYVKNNGQWYECNDNNIRETTFREMKNAGNYFNIDTTGYVLFYKKIEPLDSFSEPSISATEPLIQELTNLHNQLKSLEEQLQKK